MTSARLELATLSVLTIRDNQLHQPATWNAVRMAPLHQIWLQLRRKKNRCPKAWSRIIELTASTHRRVEQQMDIKLLKLKNSVHLSIPEHRWQHQKMKRHNIDSISHETEEGIRAFKVNRQFTTLMLTWTRIYNHCNYPDQNWPRFTPQPLLHIPDARPA